MEAAWPEVGPLHASLVRIFQIGDLLAHHTELTSLAVSHFDSNFAGIITSGKGIHARRACAKKDL